MVLLSAPVMMILIYAPLSISAEPYGGSLEKCAAKAVTRLGEKLPISPWDDMNGTHPSPTVVLAFCALGKSVE